DSCSELSSDEDLSSARIFTEVDVKNPPVPCPRFKFSGIPSVHVQFDDTSDVLQFYETLIDFSLMSKIVEETNKYAKQCIQSSVARHFSKTLTTITNDTLCQKEKYIYPEEIKPQLDLTSLFKFRDTMNLNEEECQE
ncbi:piggyBac transposable element-derived protein 4, partial [Trichonephila clavata]